MILYMRGDGNPALEELENPCPSSRESIWVIDECCQHAVKLKLCVPGSCLGQSTFSWTVDLFNRTFRPHVHPYTRPGVLHARSYPR
jgi:hypothetical protein